MPKDMVQPKYRSPIPGFHISEPFPKGWPWSYQVEVRDGHESEDQMQESMMGDSGLGYQLKTLPPSLDPSQVFSPTAQKQIGEYTKAEEIIAERDKKDAAAKKEIEEESDSTWEVITDTLEQTLKLLPQAGTAYIGMKTSEYQQALVNAQGRVYQKQKEIIDAQTRQQYQKSIIERGREAVSDLPGWVLPVVGVGVVGGVIWFMARKKGKK